MAEPREEIFQKMRKGVERMRTQQEIYDEVFKDMDDSGKECCVNMLRRRADEGKQIFGISHNNSVCSVFEDNIHVVKEKGVSYVK